MSQEPYTSPSSQASYPAQPAGSNTAGTIGFFVSLIGGLLTCGALSPLGLLISLVGLLKAPRGMAIGGTIFGLIGTGFLATVGITMITAIVGMVGFAKALVPHAETAVAITKAREVIDRHKLDKGELPDGVQGNKLILDIKDGWKNSLRYEGEPGAEVYIVRSMGADGVFDTDDDITTGSSSGETSEVEIDIPGMPMSEMPGDEGDTPEVPGDTVPELPGTEPPDSPAAPDTPTTEP